MHVSHKRTHSHIHTHTHTHILCGDCSDLLVGVELLRLGSREDLGRLFALVEETAQVAPIQR